VRRTSLIILDLDGTLLDTSRTMTIAFKEAFRAVGGQGAAPCDGLRRLQGLPFPEILRLLNLPAAMADLFAEASARHVGRSVVFNGVPAMLRSLRMQGCRLAAATGKTSRRARVVLDHFGMTSYFDLILGSDDVLRGKPAPDMLLRAMAELGCTPDRTAMLGDAPADREAAARAGVGFVWAGWGCRPEEIVLDRGCRLASSVAEAEALLVEPDVLPPGMPMHRARTHCRLLAGDDA
jgi:AHBA synthesis associated protein